MKKEKRIVELMKLKYAVNIRNGERYLALSEHVGEVLKLGHRAPLSDEVRINKLCPKDEKTKLISVKDKYKCTSCNFEFDKEIWDEAVKVKEEYRKTSNYIYTEAEKLQEKFSDGSQHAKWHEELLKKYGKEPWWDSAFLRQAIFGRTH